MAERKKSSTKKKIEVSTKEIVKVEPIVEESKVLKVKKCFNRILNDEARHLYTPVIKELFEVAPDILERKIPDANVQQAFILDTVRHFTPKNGSILGVGTFDDTAWEVLVRQHSDEYTLVGVDPNYGTDLNSEWTNSKQKYDMIFATSVIEHVPDDLLFIRQMVDLLKPGGVITLTADYHPNYYPGMTIVPGLSRFYTENDLRVRLPQTIPGCQFVDEPDWICEHIDFFNWGVYYTFATFTVRKDG
tara:strand:+ start:2605 stop:3342 length:738 start_codon:yes stop_codon:yes gene_type:complete